MFWIAEREREREKRERERKREEREYKKREKRKKSITKQTHLALHMVAEKQVAKDQLVLGELLPGDDNGKWPLDLVV